MKQHFSMTFTGQLREVWQKKCLESIIYVNLNCELIRYICLYILLEPKLILASSPSWISIKMHGRDGIHVLKIRIRRMSFLRF